MLVGHLEDDLGVPYLAVDVKNVAKKLDDFDLHVEGIVLVRGEPLVLFVDEVLGADAVDHVLAHVVLKQLHMLLGHLDLEVGAPGDEVVLLQPSIKEVHRGGADEAGDEHVDRVMVDFVGLADLLDEAVLHDDDAGCHGHGLDLVVGDVDRGRADLVMDADDLRPHRDAEFGVEVRKRLVHVEDLGTADDGPAKGDALTLAAREGARLAAEIRGEFEDLGRLGNAAIDSSLGTFLSFKA